MQNRNVILVVGSMNTDMVVRTERMPKPGETVLGGEFMMNQGGKGANQAVAAAKLGGNVVFVGKVGNDIFGSQTIEILNSIGVDTTYISKSDLKPSGVALINVDAKGENSITVASGANSMLEPADIDAVEHMLDKVSFVVMQLESPIETVTYAAKLAKKHGANVILNPAPAPSQPLPDDLLENVDIIIPNTTEAELITGVSLAEEKGEVKAIEILGQKGIDTVIITLGSKGALVCDHGKIEHVPSFAVKAVDTTAAGDTFCGALTVALSEGKSLNDAVIFANKAASISVTRMGAQPSIPTRDEIF